jgi:DNA-directed RNA polymerase specialized sigma24 family protein
MAGTTSAAKCRAYEGFEVTMRRTIQEHREIIDLVYYHEKSVKEVSVILDIPENTVKTRMFYARKKLTGFLYRPPGRMFGNGK